MTHRMLVGSLAALAFAPAVQAMELGSVDIHGFVSQGYLISNENDYISEESQGGTFEYSDVGINFGTDVTENIRIGIQFFSRDFGEWSNNELLLDWAYGDAYLLDEFSIRAGKVKLPKGLWQDVQDFDFLRVWAILPTSVYDPSFRAFGNTLYGAQAYGTFDLQSAGALSYQLTIGDNDINESNDVERLVTFEAAPDLDDANTSFQVNAHLEYEAPVDGLRFVATFVHVDDLDMQVSGSGSAIIGSTGAGGIPPFTPIIAPTSTVITYDFDHYQTITFGVEYLWEQWSFYGEYFRTFAEFDLSATTTSGGVVFDQTDLEEVEANSEGWYLGVGYRHDDHWNFGGYFSSYNNDPSDRSGDDLENDYERWRYDLALSVRYDINEFWLIKGEAHFVNGVADIGQYNDDELEENWQYFALKTTFNF